MLAITGGNPARFVPSADLYRRALRVPDGVTDHADRLGIVGAGKVGTSIARAAIATGYDVWLSGSAGVDRLALTAEILAPGATPSATEQVVAHARLIVLAVPIHRFRELPHGLFDRRIVVDAMNYWEPIEGHDPERARQP